MCVCLTVPGLYHSCWDLTGGQEKRHGLLNILLCWTLKIQQFKVVDKAEKTTFAQKKKKINYIRILKCYVIYHKVVFKMYILF